MASKYNREGSIEHLLREHTELKTTIETIFDEKHLWK